MQLDHLRVGHALGYEIIVCNWAELWSESPAKRPAGRFNVTQQAAWTPTIDCLAVLTHGWAVLLHAFKYTPNHTIQDLATPSCK